MAMKASKNAASITHARHALAKLMRAILTQDFSLQAMKSGERRDVVGGVLRLRNVSLRDGGLYKCLAVNALATIVTETLFRVSEGGWGWLDMGEVVGGGWVVEGG